jgi:DNA-binding NtrC family response regulator
MTDTLNILILDDEKGYREEVGEYLTTAGYGVYTAELPTQFFDIIGKNRIDLAILDIRLPEMDGLEVLRRVKSLKPDIEVIMITGHGDMQSVIDAIRHGAVDFFNKPFLMSDVQKAIERTKKYLSFSSSRKSPGRTRDSLDVEMPANRVLQIIGKSDAMKDVLHLIRKVSQSDHTTVLVTGETGTGKEVIAMAIHQLSQRKDRPFYPVNCSAIPEELFESAFFGHKKGSFTGAVNDHLGWFEVADKGTLFLDEIGDLKPSLQSKLLRVIEEKKIARIGSKEFKDVDVRVIAATNQDLRALVDEKKFRADLFHRLTSFVIAVPPLRERKADIPLLFKLFLEEYTSRLNRPVSKIDKRIPEEMLRYDFPGNVRELRNMIERAVICSDGEKLMLDDFQYLKFIHKSLRLATPEKTPEIFDLDQVEKTHILLALKKVMYNKSKAARLLNISRQALDRKIQKYGIGPETE